MNKLRVGDVYKLHGTAYISVYENVSLEDIISRFTLYPGLRGAFLVDSRERFASMVSRIDLLRWTHIRLFSGRGRREITISEFYRLADATLAIELVRRDMSSYSVKESDSLQTALDMMLDYDEDIIPVINNEGFILGDLRLSEILLKALETGKPTQT